MNGVAALGQSASASILLVDDDETTRLLIGSVLGDAGYQVLEAANGAEALELMHSRHVDCIVTDITMPVMDGYDLCTAVRNDPAHARVQILFLTGLNDRESIRRAYSVGANDFASKQSHPLVLLERVRFLLRAQQMQDALRTSELRLMNVQRMARLGHWERRLDGTTLAISPVVLELIGEAVDALPDWPTFLARIPPADRVVMEQALAEADTPGALWHAEHRLRLRGGERVLRHQGEIAQDEDGALLIRSAVLDVTELRAHEERIRFLAQHDPLTSLPNREALTETLASLTTGPSLRHARMAVFAIGIDDTERITGSLGRKAVDGLLKICGERLATQLRRTDARSSMTLRGGTLSLVARADGDKFLCAVDMRDVVDTVPLARRLQQALESPITLGADELLLTASVGVSLFPEDATSGAEMIEHALAALAHTGARRGACQFFTGEISTRARQRLSLEGELRRALEAHQFVLYYQPRLHTATGGLSGAEALVRWRHPTRGIVGPGEFVPVMEETGLIGRLGSEVVGMAAEQSVLWGERFGADFRVSCNISPVQFGPMDVVSDIDEAIARAHARHKFLEVEITEGALLGRSERVQSVLAAFRERGVRLALDDFGTGFSSLSYLKSLPLDVLKIDRSFVADIGVSDSGSSLVLAILQMAHALGLECVAEGVEDPRQLQFLAEHGCREVQGFLLARPMPADEFERWFAESEPRRRHDAAMAALSAAARA
jgi:diguanylate cyclase (GGDEF)-like protein